jgi:hypothetical protein
MPYDRADHDYSTERATSRRACGNTSECFWPAAQHQLLNDFHEQRSQQFGSIAQSPDHRPSILRSGLPGAVREKDLNVEGNAFAEHYYRSPTASVCVF